MFSDLLLLSTRSRDLVYSESFEKYSITIIITMHYAADHSFFFFFLVIMLNSYIFLSVYMLLSNLLNTTQQPNNRDSTPQGGLVHHSFCCYSFASSKLINSISHRFTFTPIGETFCL